ncbi:MAG: substrate-binding domain-containing protein [Lysinibacillus sp.]
MKVTQAVLVFLGILFIAGNFSFVFMLNGQYYYLWIVAAVALSVFLLTAFAIFEFFTTKKRKRNFAAFVMVFILLSVIPTVYHQSIERIPTVDAEIDIFEYEPFGNNGRVVAMDGKVSFKMEEPLVKIDGATAMYPLYAAFVQATYPQKEYNPYASEVMVNTTPIAYSKLFDGEVDLIFAAAPSESQRKTAEQKGLTLKMTPIGREAFVFFVHHKNAVDNLSIEQIKNIYAGEMTNWQEVGGKGDEIRAFQRPADSGSQSALEKLMGDVPIMEAPSENIAAGMGGIINEVSKYRNYKNAIGYTFRFYSTEMVGNDEIKLLSINGVTPSKETIRTGEYPISSEFYAITAGTDNPNIQPFIDWILSAEGQAIVEKVGYVPVTK